MSAEPSLGLGPRRPNPISGQLREVLIDAGRDAQSLDELVDALGGPGFIQPPVVRRMLRGLEVDGTVEHLLRVSDDQDAWRLR